MRWGPKKKNKKSHGAPPFRRRFLAIVIVIVIAIVTAFPLSSSLIYTSTKPTPCRPLYGRAKRAIAPWQAGRVLVL